MPRPTPPVAPVTTHHPAHRPVLPQSAWTVVAVMPALSWPSSARTAPATSRVDRAGERGERRRREDDRRAREAGRGGHRVDPHPAAALRCGPATGTASRSRRPAPSRRPGRRSRAAPAARRRRRWRPDRRSAPRPPPAPRTSGRTAPRGGATQPSSSSSSRGSGSPGSSVQAATTTDRDRGPSAAEVRHASSSVGPRPVDARRPARPRAPRAARPRSAVARSRTASQSVPSSSVTPGAPPGRAGRRHRSPRSTTTVPFTMVASIPTGTPRKRGTPSTGSSWRRHVPTSMRSGSNRNTSAGRPVGEHAAVGQPEDRGRDRGHQPDGLLQPPHLLGCATTWPGSGSTTPARRHGRGGRRRRTRPRSSAGASARP